MSLTNRLSALAAQKAREEMQTLHNYSPFQVAVTGFFLSWFKQLVETHLHLAAFWRARAGLLVLDGRRRASVVREVRAAARAAARRPRRCARSYR